MGGPSGGRTVLSVSALSARLNVAWHTVTVSPPIAAASGLTFDVYFRRGSPLADDYQRSK